VKCHNGQKGSIARSIVRLLYENTLALDFADTTEWPQYPIDSRGRIEKKLDPVRDLQAFGSPRGIHLITVASRFLFARYIKGWGQDWSNATRAGRLDEDSSATMDSKHGGNDSHWLEAIIRVTLTADKTDLQKLLGA